MWRDLGGEGSTRSRLKEGGVTAGSEHHDRRRFEWEVVGEFELPVVEPTCARAVCVGG